MNRLEPDLYTCLLIQKLADNQYVEVELSFEPSDGSNYDSKASSNVFWILLEHLDSLNKAVLPNIRHLTQKHLGLSIYYDHEKPLSEQNTRDQQWKLIRITNLPYSSLYHENIPV